MFIHEWASNIVETYPHQQKICPSRLRWAEMPINLSRFRWWADVLAKFNKCNGPDKRFKVVPLAYLLDRNHLEPQNKYENTMKSKEKPCFFGLLTSCLVWPICLSILTYFSRFQLFHPIPDYSSLIQKLYPQSQYPILNPQSPIWNAQLWILSPTGHFVC